MLTMLTTALLMLSCFPAVGQAQSFERRAVVEEFTGTWCGNCPRGMVGLQRLDEQFGERVILVAVHSGDAEPMVIPTYPSLVPAGHGVPSCNLNRKGYLDPYCGGGTRGAFHYGIDVEVAYELEQKAEADVKLTAQWNDTQQWDVRFTATTTFDHNSDDAHYRLAFILVEDGLSGTGANWMQENYFSTASGYADSQNYTDDDMTFWRDAAPRVENMEYDHVAVNTLGIKDGIAGSIKTPITAYSPQVYSSLVTTLNVKVIPIYATKAEASAGTKPAASQSTLFAYFTRGAKVAVSYHQGEDRGNCGSVFIDKAVNAPGDQVTVRALPNDGFQFEYWQDASDMGNIVSRDNPYTFTVGGGERLYAYFTAIDAPVVNLPEEGGFTVMIFDGPWVMTDDARRAGEMVLVMEAEDLVRTADGKAYLDMTKEESHFDVAQGNSMPTIIYGKGAVRFAYKLDYGYARKNTREALVQWSTARGTNVKGENLYVYAFRPDLGAFVTIGNSDHMLNPEVSTTISVPSNTAYFKMDAFDLVDDQGNIPTVIGLSPETYDKVMYGIEDTPTANAQSSAPAIYDLQGRPVQGKPNRGLYIIDGKKHSVK